MSPMSEKVGTEVVSAADSSFEITVANEQSHIAIEPEWLRQITRSVLCGEGIESAQISIALVDDAAIHAINAQFLRHDCPTDVISFSLEEPAAMPSLSPKGERDSMDGEVVISAETALRSAGEVGCSPEEELALYLAHGLLHLCGYDDQSAADRRQMRGREKSHLQKLGIRSN